MHGYEKKYEDKIQEILDSHRSVNLYGGAIVYGCCKCR